MTASRLPRA